MRLVRIAWEALREQSLQLELDCCNCLGVEQLTKVFAAEQLGQQLAIQRERLRAPFGQRRVAGVHELRYIREKEGRREGRRTLGVDGDHPDLARTDRTQQTQQGRHVEVIRHHLAPGLGEDREVGILTGDLQQARAAHSLLPQGSAPARTPARQQK